MKNKLYFKYSFIISLLFPLISNAQFAPAAGEPGSTAIFKDSSIFTSWAINCIVERGFINIEDTEQTYTQGDVTSNYAFFGNNTDATGEPDGTGVVSLGDGGFAVLTFNKPIMNGEGADFAVFENGFQLQSPPYQYFLELAFVEVSTNGTDYVRFPSISLTQSENQIGNFGQLDPTKIHNFAGKYIANYGTPFDLEDLSGNPLIDVNNINYIKIIDVIGDINDSYAQYDSNGNKINDPWSTPYASCGFDLDAVGIIHSNNNIGITNNNSEHIKIFPNPLKKGTEISIDLSRNNKQIKNIKIFNLQGKIVFQTKVYKNKISIKTSTLSEKVYFIKVETNNNIFLEKLLILN